MCVRVGFLVFFWFGFWSVGCGLFWLVGLATFIQWVALKFLLG